MNQSVNEAAANVGLGTLPTWNLTDLYPGIDSSKVQDELATSLDRARTFEGSYKGRLAELASQNISGLVTALQAYEDLQDFLGKLISYAGLVYAEDTTRPENQKFYGDVQERITTAGSHLLFFELELNQVDDALLNGAMEKEPRLAHYRPWLEDLRKEKPFQLEDRVEQLFHEKSVTGAGAWNRLFDETIAALKFDVGGSELAIEPTLNILQEADPARREMAARALAEIFSEKASTFTLITNTLAKDKEISDRWRGFEDIADSRHLANRVEREVVEAMVGAVRDAYPRLSHRYYAMKARWLGQEKLNFWDRNAPLPEADTSVIPWETARKIVLDAYGNFDSELSEIASRFFEKQWIDAPARPGKAPGAFAHPTVPSAHPYVLVNYQGRTRDVMTLAHELGHGIHQVLAAHNGSLMAPTPLTLAETASVFGEMLTFRSLLEQAMSPRARKALLAAKAEDMINTVVRQIAFYSFERKVHTERRKGELTSQVIGALWLEAQAESLGSAIELNEGYDVFWSYIPHFIHSPFYVYAYAFGDCLVNSLYAAYQTQLDGFQGKYKELLKAGGTRHHSDLLAPFDLDATDPLFWAKGLSVIEGIIDELETLES